MSEWQPIETCPRGEWVLLFGDPWSNNGQSFGVGRCSDVVEEWWEQTSETRQELKSRTRIDWDVEGIIPTHWMPLPDAPTP